MVMTFLQGVVETKRPRIAHGRLVPFHGIHRVQRAAGVPGRVRRLRNGYETVPNAIVHQRRGERVQRHVHDVVGVQRADVRRHGHHPNHVVLSLRLVTAHVTNVLHHQRVSHDSRTGTAYMRVTKRKKLYI